MFLATAFHSPKDLEKAAPKARPSAAVESDGHDVAGEFDDDEDWIPG